MALTAYRPRGWFARLAGWFDRLGACGNVGLILGIIAGGLLTILSFRTAYIRPTLFELFWIFVLLSLFCWAILVFMGLVFLRLQLRSILWGMLMRSLMICLFTLLIAYYLGAYRYGIVIGIFVGLFFGLLLCGVHSRMRG